MKTKFYLALAAMGVIALASSCSKDAADATLESAGDTAKVSFTFAAPENATTRAYFGEYGSKADVQANMLYYDIINYDTKESVYGSIQSKEVDSYPYKLEVQLLRNQSYEIICWAQNKDCKAYTVLSDPFAVKIDYSAMKGNDTQYDAFVGENLIYLDENNGGTSDNAYQYKVTLQRPFAQLNLGILNTDLEGAKALGFTPKSVKVKFLSSIPSKIELVTGSVSEEVADVTFESDVLYSGDGNDPTIEYSGRTYYQLAMNYIPVNGKQTVDVAYSLVSKEDGTEIVLTPTNSPYGEYEGLRYIPLQSNYRTNILGNSFLAPTAAFDIDVLPGFQTKDNNMEFSEELANQFYEQLRTSSGKVTLKTNIKISGIDFTIPAANKNITEIDLNGYGIYSSQSGLLVSGGGNLTIRNGQIYARWDAVSVNGSNTNVTLEDLTCECDEFTVWVSGSNNHVIINSGSYAILDATVNPEYPTETGLAITGGGNTSHYTVNGGTFINWNPADNYYSQNKEEGWLVYDDQGGAGWVPAGYKCEQTAENTWKVSAAK